MKAMVPSRNKLEIGGVIKTCDGAHPYSQHSQGRARWISVSPRPVLATE